MGFNTAMYVPPPGTSFPPSPPSPVLRGKTIFVSSVGSSGGTRQDVVYHFSTIQEAINVFQEGDIIAVYPGTYTEDLNIAQDTDIYIYCMPGVVITPQSTRIAELSATPSTFHLFGSAVMVIPDGLYGFKSYITGNDLHLEFHNAYLSDTACLVETTAVNVFIKCNDVHIHSKGTPFAFAATEPGQNVNVYLDFNFIGDNQSTQIDSALATGSCVNVNSNDADSSFIIKGKRMQRNALGPMITVNNWSASPIVFAGKLTIDIDQVNVEYSGSTVFYPELNLYSCFLYLHTYMEDTGYVDVKANVYAIGSCNGIVTSFYISPAQSSVLGKGFTFTGIIESKDEPAVQAFGNFLAQCHFNGLFTSNNSSSVFELGTYIFANDPFSQNTMVIIEGQIRQYGTGNGISIQANQAVPATSIRPILKNLTIYKDNRASGNSIRAYGALIDAYVYQAQANVASSGVNELVSALVVSTDVI